MGSTGEPIFEHVFVPRSGANVTLLLLHGTGGNERDLLPLGQEVLPGAALLSPRGRVLENGMPRFFRRFAEGVFDVADLQARADELATWTRAQVALRSAPPRIVAVGFSNGANIAAGMLLRTSDLLAGAVLIRATVPYEPEAPPSLAGTRVLVSAGDADSLVPRAQGERLAAILRAGGADVTLAWQRAAHGLVASDVTTATAFLAPFAGAGEHV